MSWPQFVGFSTDLQPVGQPWSTQYALGHVTVPSLFVVGYVRAHVASVVLQGCVAFLVVSLSQAMAMLVAINAPRAALGSRLLVFIFIVLCFVNSEALD